MERELNGKTVVFGLPMPQSWSKKRKDEMDGAPHTQRPDVDNLLKALMDALHVEDCMVHDIRVIKVWARKPFITMYTPHRLGVGNAPEHLTETGVGYGVDCNVVRVVHSGDAGMGAAPDDQTNKTRT